MSLRGTLPSSSMISAMWSTWSRGAWGEGRTNETNNRFVRQSPSRWPTLGVCGWRVEGSGWQHTHTNTHVFRPYCCRGCREQAYMSKSVHQTWPPDIYETSSISRQFEFYVVVNNKARICEGSVLLRSVIPLSLIRPVYVLQVSHYVTTVFNYIYPPKTRRYRTKKPKNFNKKYVSYWSHFYKI